MAALRPSSQMQPDAAMVPQLVGFRGWLLAFAVLQWLTTVVVVLEPSVALPGYEIALNQPDYRTPLRILTFVSAVDWFGTFATPYVMATRRRVFRPFFIACMGYRALSRIALAAVLDLVCSIPVATLLAEAWPHYCLVPALAALQALYVWKSTRVRNTFTR